MLSVAQLHKAELVDTRNGYVPSRCLLNEGARRRPEGVPRDGTSDGRQHLPRFFPDSFRADSRQLRRVMLNRRTGLRVDRQTESRGKTHRSHQP